MSSKSEEGATLENVYGKYLQECATYAEDNLLVRQNHIIKEKVENLSILVYCYCNTMCNRKYFRDRRTNKLY